MAIGQFFNDEEEKKVPPAPVKTSPDYDKYTAGIAGDTNVKAYEATHDKATGDMRFDYNSRKYKNPEEWKTSQQPTVNLKSLKEQGTARNSARKSIGQMIAEGGKTKTK